MCLGLHLVYTVPRMDQPRVSRMLGKPSTSAALDTWSLITQLVVRELWVPWNSYTHICHVDLRLSLCWGCYLQPGQRLRRSEPQLSLGKTSRLQRELGPDRSALSSASFLTTIELHPKQSTDQKKSLVPASTLILYSVCTSIYVPILLIPKNSFQV